MTPKESDSLTMHTPDPVDVPIPRDNSSVSSKPSAEQRPPCGQWIGTLFTHGMASPGLATLSIEADNPHRAIACIDQGNGLPPSRLDLSYNQTGTTFEAVSTGPALVFDYERSVLVPIGSHPDAQKFGFSKEITVSGSIHGNALRGEWRGDSGAEGTFDLANEIGRLTQADHNFTWAEFRQFCGELAATSVDCLFRGHASHRWDLSTSFHREKHYDLLRYREKACVPLARDVGALLGRRYDLNNGVEFGAVLSTAQHHGFPTPLLDWTRSPYIAAYFAISGASAEDDQPRVFMFNTAEWNRLPQPADLNDPRPALSLREFEALGNPRLVPQQSVHTFSNVADIEGWIRHLEKKTGRRFLKIIDLPRGERQCALRDLAYMGVTPAALFPGIEGVCRTVKERTFLLK